MDKKTRVLNAMDCKPVDRVPVSFYTHFLSPETSKDNCVPAALNWLKSCNMDFLCVETDGYMEYPLPRQKDCIDDWKHLIPLNRSSHYYTGQLDRAKRISEAAQDSCIFFMLFAPFTTIKHTIGGEEKIMKYYREDPETLNDAMKAIQESTFILADMLTAQTQITGFFLALQNAECDRFSTEEYKSYLAKWDLELLEYLNTLSDYNITHMCSWTGVPNNLDLWKDYPYKTVNWSVNIEPKMNMAQARSYFRKGTSLMGGFDNTKKGILYNGGKAEIKEFTKRQLDLAGQTGTLLCADCSVQMDQSPQSIRYVIEACEEYADEHP